MNVLYRQTILVELEGDSQEALHSARLKLEKAMSMLGSELSRMKGGRLLALIPDKVREYDPAAKPKG